MKFASNLIYFIKLQKIRINSKKEYKIFEVSFLKKCCNFFLKLVDDVYLDFLRNYLMSMFAVYKSLIHNIYTCSSLMLHLHMGCGGRLGCLSNFQMSLTELYNTLLRSTYRSTLFFQSLHREHDDGQGFQNSFHQIKIWHQLSLSHNTDSKRLTFGFKKK